jgi:diguanylate cyclase (GGDEF)-like protein
LKQTVLVINGSAPVCGLIRARLRDEPVELLFAATAAAGLTLAASSAPDLILLDVDLPDGDGLDVCARLKADPVTMGVPVVLLTGAASGDERARGLELGATDYITKPFDAAELRARVRATLRTKFLLDLLAHKAQIDGLTGLWNRAYFDGRLRSELSLASRTNAPLTVVLLDLDNFKRVNAEAGHPAGDAVLRAVAGAMQESARVSDVVCRYGGEEFAIVAPNTHAAGSNVLGGRLRARVAAVRVPHKGRDVSVTASLGVATAAPGQDAAALVASATAALNRAKQNGRDRVEAA